MKQQRHQYFQKQTEGFSREAILIPDMPMRLDNNCKEGAWQLGSSTFGQRLQLLAVKFSHRIHFGNEYIAPGTPIGQLWFVPVAGGVGTDEQGKETQLPLNICYYCLLKNSRSGKSGSLINFGQKATLVQAQGLDYREVVWCPRFVKKSGTIINDAGQPENASWYILDWSFITPDNQPEPIFNRVRSVIEILQSEEQMARLFDPTLETESRCVDELSSNEISTLSASLKQKTLAAASPD